MLVLTREPEERIALKLPDGQYIWVTLIEIRRGKARIGIKAPREVQIMREEIMPAGEAVSPGHNGSP
jgi:carbon storage regulator